MERVTSPFHSLKKTNSSPVDSRPLMWLCAARRCVYTCFKAPPLITLMFYLVKFAFLSLYKNALRNGCLVTSSRAYVSKIIVPFIKQISIQLILNTKSINLYQICTFIIDSIVKVLLFHRFYTFSK